MAEEHAQTGAQEGSRWINERPSGEEVAHWFAENVRLHDGLQHAHYVQGLTLIPNKEKIKVARRNQAGATILVDEERLVFTPYAKVETRIAYFWDFCRHNSYLGIIEPANPGDPGLPPGFFRFEITKADGRPVHYLCCSMQVRVYEAPSEAEGEEVYRPGWYSPPGHPGLPSKLVERLQEADRGRPVMTPPAGTKMVGLLNRFGDDPNSIMKAETGAVGRALGMAGMLVIPGSGVATAEDMIEAAAQPGGISVSPEAELPDDEPEAPSSLKERAEALIARVTSEHPEKLEELHAWAKERKLNLNELTEESPALRAVVRQLERKLEVES